MYDVATFAIFAKPNRKEKIITVKYVLFFFFSLTEFVLKISYNSTCFNLVHFTIFIKLTSLNVTPN